MAKMQKEIFVSLLITAGCIFALSLGCGSKKSGEAKMTVSANLYEGQISPLAVQSILMPLAAQPMTPMAGYQLYCVTFTNPPVAGKGTSDSSGAVTVTLNIGSTALGCFILDSSDKGVATVIFTDVAGTQNGQTVSVSESMNLGTITVSLTSGVALAIMPSSVTLTTTPSSVPCPVGTWFVDTGTANCVTRPSVASHVDFWIAQTPSGQYTFSYTNYSCSTESKSNIPLTYSDGVFTATFNPESDPSICPSKSITVTMTPNSPCTTATGQGTVSGASYTTPSCGGCGPMVCAPVPLTATRK